jgi:acetyl esterase
MTISIEPTLFSPEAVSPETKAFNEQLEAMLKDLPPIHQREPQEIRDERERGEGTFGPLQLVAEAQERTIAGPSGEVPVRVFVPQTVHGVYLHIHGGGWVLGRAHHQDVRNWAIARHCEVAVVSVDYRLAPEHPYPAGPDDCETVAVWLAEQSKAEYGAEHLLIGGESAGGHLAAATLLRMRDRHGYTGFRAANLVYGCYDLGMTPSVVRWGTRELILSTPTIAWFLDHFVPEERRRDPDVSPLYADLSGMPPALFTVGTLDPLLDDSLFMYTRWLAAGNEAELTVYPGGLHGFNAFPTALAQEANARIDAFLTAALVNTSVV